MTARGVTSLVSGNADFFYHGPTLTSLSPPSGPDTGYTTVTLSGTLLDHVETVYCDLVAVAFTATSPTLITAVVPPGNGGVSISVRSRYGSTAGPLGYVYDLTPTIAQISPVSGPAAGQTSVVLSGHDLMAGYMRLYDTIWFGDLFGFITSYTDSQITVDTPAGSGQVDILVEAQGSKTVVGQYTYLAPGPLTITGLDPSSGPTAGGTDVVITGTGLGNVMALCFGTTNVIFTVVSDIEIHAIAPSGSGRVYVLASAWTLETTAPGPANVFSYG